MSAAVGSTGDTADEASSANFPVAILVCGGRSNGCGSWAGMVVGDGGAIRSAVLVSVLGGARA